MSESRDYGKSYSYDPEKVREPGKDRMRFELGDVMVEGGSKTTALTDAEIEAAIESHPKSWKRAKLMLLESLFRRFAYEPDTRTGPLTLELKGRAELWRKDYEALKKELELDAAASFFSAGQERRPKPPYFHTDMHVNERVKTL